MGNKKTPCIIKVLHSVLMYKRGDLYMCMNLYLKLKIISKFVNKCIQLSYFYRAEPWDGVIGGDKQTTIAYQNSQYFDFAFSSYLPIKPSFHQTNCKEDCLYLNVYKPDSKKKALPVSFIFCDFLG